MGEGPLQARERKRQKTSREVRDVEDVEIIRLYWARDESAIPAAAEKYGNYCASIAQNLLGNREDAEECVNDTWLRAWNAIPPQQPGILSAFLGTITRNLALDLFQRRTAQKRGGGTATVLEELEGLVSGTDDVEREIDRRELLQTIDEFLAGVSADKRRIFVCRYWYFDPVTEIAARFGMTENNVSVTLNRMRRKLRSYLTERGFAL